MTNELGNFNAQYYAQLALMWLRKKLGVAGLVNRHYEGERQAFELGDVVKIRRPSTFVSQTHVAGVGTNNQDINAQNVNIDIQDHEEVKFSVTDRELAVGGKRLMDEHIGPATNALAEKIEADIYGMARKVASAIDVSAAASASVHLADVRKKLKGQLTPFDGQVFYTVDEETEAAFLNDSFFHAANIVGGNDNKEALVGGMLGDRLGLKIFPSQLARQTLPQATGTIAANSGAGDSVGAVNNGGGYPVNTATIAVDSFTGTETAKAEVDSFTIAGDTTKYMLTADLTLVAGAGNVSFYPPLQKPVADDAVITFRVRTAREDNAAGWRENLAFHRNALALVMVPLGMEGEGAGAQIGIARDPESGLALRLRKFYNGNTATVSLAVDALYGKQVLDSQLATRTLLVP